MPHSKKPRLLLSDSARSASAPRRSPRVAGRPNASMNDLSDDLLALIFGCLGPVDIMRARCCKKWREAAKKTTVPSADFAVYNGRGYNFMVAMATALPNLQKIKLGSLGRGHKYVDGEDPFEESYTPSFDRVDNYITHDIEVLSNFTKLTDLELYPAPLNGRYPFLFNNFQFLQKLHVINCFSLKWNLEVLGSMPMLKDLHIQSSPVIGNTRDFRVLKDTLECIEFHNLQFVEGDFMDFADFPHLTMLCLGLFDVRVRGDVRDIGENDFPQLKSLYLPEIIYGGHWCYFDHISDVPDVIRALYRFIKIDPDRYSDCNWCLSGSPDWYDSEYQENDAVPGPPFDVQFVRAGKRLGWRWGFHYEEEWYDLDSSCQSCEINWLDPEPDRGSDDYETYMIQLSNIEQEIDFFRGYHQPPTAEEYNRLCRELINT